MSGTVQARRAARRRRTRRAALAFAGAIAALSSNAEARADTDAERAATAQTLYDSAVALMDAKKFADACPKLEEVTRLIPEGIGARLTLAECYEGDDRLASAWAVYVNARAAAARAHQADREAKAGAKVDELKPKLAHLVIRVPEALSKLEGLRVEQDDFAVGSPEWGEPLPVDVGDHTITASAPHKVAFAKHVHVDRDGDAIEVALEPLKDAPASEGKADANPRAIVDARPWQRPLGISLGVVGLASAGVGFGLGGAAMMKRNAASKECNAALLCTQKGLDLRASGRTFANAATALIVTGSVLAVAGVVVAVTAPSSPKSEVKIGVGWASLEGAF
jgi:hypothetical protein